MRHEARQVPSWLIFDVRQKKEAGAMIARGRIASLATTGIPVDGGFECGGFGCEFERQFPVRRELRLVSEGRVRVMAAACLDRKSEGFGRFSRAFLAVGLDPKKTPNKAPEPTPGPVTSRAVLVSEIISSRRARLAPGPVVAHL